MVFWITSRMKAKKREQVNDKLMVIKLFIPIMQEIYFKENKDTLIPVYLPTASPEFMVMEQIWNIAKQDLLVLKYYSSFADLKNKISGYFRTKRFNLNMKLSVKGSSLIYANWYKSEYNLQRYTKY